VQWSVRLFVCIGDPSIDSHARFNLSPVPSVEDDEDDGVGHQTRRGLVSIDQDDSGEEADLAANAPGSTTTVTMFDKNHGVRSSLKDKHNDQGLENILISINWIIWFWMNLF
jgi:hypothetical protein